MNNITNIGINHLAKGNWENIIELDLCYTYIIKMTTTLAIEDVSSFRK